MLTIRNLNKTFNAGTANEVRALAGVSLDVEEGSFLIILGGNGSGKSTLLNAIAGSFPVDGGSIELDGRDLSSLEEHERAAWIGRVFQNPFLGTAPNMTIAENFAMAALRGNDRTLKWALRKSRSSEIAAMIACLRMGLENRLHTPICNLSGGQRQALTLLMATWNKPRLLLLDEHTAALDPRSAEAVVRLTRELVEKESLTAIMVTHSMQQAVRLGNRLIIMHRGQIAHDFSGPARMRLQVDDLLEAFDEIRRTEMLDETAAEILRAAYV